MLQIIYTTGFRVKRLTRNTRQTKLLEIGNWLDVDYHQLINLFDGSVD